MANDRSGLALGVQLGFEDSFGAGAAAPAGHVIPRAALRFDAVETPGETPEISYSANPSEPIDGLHNANGELGVVVTADAIPLIFKAFTGNIATTGGGAPYTHTSKLLANAMLSVWLEKWFDDIDKGELYKGVRIQGLRFSWRKDSQPLIVTAMLMGSGQRDKNRGTQYDATPTTYTDRRLSLVSTVLKINGTATALVKSFDLTITNEMARQDVLSGNDYADAISTGKFKIEGSLRAVWDSADTLRGYIGTEKSIELICYRPAAATRYVSVLTPEVLLKFTEVPDESSRGPIELGMGVFAYYNNAAEATAAVLTAVNDVASGAYV